MRRPPCSFNAIPSSHWASVISRRSICGTAPAILIRASILPNRFKVSSTSVLSAAGSRRTSGIGRASAPASATALATSSSASPLRAASTTEEKSPASLKAVARPMPWLAPVIMTTLRFMVRLAVMRLGVLANCADCLEENVNDCAGSGQHRRMIGGVGAHRGSHARRLERLGLGRNHSVIFGDKEPYRLVFPQRPGGFFQDAAHFYRPLGCKKYRFQIRRRILGESMLEAFGRHPNESGVIGGQFWGLDVGWFAVKYLRHGFSLVRREGCHVNEQLYALIFGSTDNRPRVRMPNEDYVDLNPGQG